MLFTPLKTFAQKLRAQRPRHRIRHHSRRACRRRRTAYVSQLIAAEQLEDRTLLSAYTVDIAADELDVAHGGTDVDTGLSLREAIVAANALAGDDTITLPAGTYTLILVGAGEDAAVTGDLDITDTTGSLTITGAGAGTTIIDVNAVTTVVNSTISGNSANGTAGHGGGIYNQETGAVVTVINSTISGNVSAVSGGGIRNVSTVHISNSTITDNTAGSAGGGVHSSGSTDIQNSIIAANTAVFRDDISGSGFVSLGNNLIGDNDGTAGFTDGVNGDQVGTSSSPVDPLLGPLQDNGGPRFTHALLLSSPAIDAASSTDASGAPITADQRGLSRPQGVANDIGAFEVEVTNAPPVADAGGPYTFAEGGSIQLDASASTDPDQDPTTLSYAWDLDGDDVFGETGAAATRGDETGIAPTFSAAGLDGSSVVTVGLRVTDDGGLTSTDTATINITNVAPTVVFDPLAAINENGVTTLTGTITDPGTLDTFTLDINWGDPLSPNNTETYTFGASAIGSQTFSLTHQYLDDNPTATPQDTYTISATVIDDGGGANQSTNAQTITINFTGEVFLVTGTPFGITANIGDPVSVSVTYDLSISDTVGSSTFGSYPQTLVSGYSMTVGGSVIETSSYTVFVFTGTTDGFVVAANDFFVDGTLVAAAGDSQTRMDMTLNNNSGDSFSDDSLPIAFDITKHSVQNISIGQSAQSSGLPDNQSIQFRLDTAAFTSDGPAEVLVNNVAPVAVIGDPSPVDEGTKVTFIGSFTDQGEDDSHAQAWSVLAGNVSSTPKDDHRVRYVPSLLRSEWKL